MSETHERVSHGDPNSTRLLDQLMDKIDKVLFAHGFEFRDDERDWAEAAGHIEKWVFDYYDDLTGGDSDYDPKKPAYVDSDEVEVEGEVSSDEEVDSDECSACGSECECDELEPVQKRSRSV